MGFHIVRVTAVIAVNDFGTDCPPFVRDHITVDEGTILDWKEQILTLVEKVEEEKEENDE